MAHMCCGDGLHQHGAAVWSSFPADSIRLHLASAPTVHKTHLPIWRGAPLPRAVPLRAREEGKRGTVTPNKDESKNGEGGRRKGEAFNALYIDIAKAIMISLTAVRADCYQSTTVTGKRFPENRLRSLISSALVMRHVGCFQKTSS